MVLELCIVVVLELRVVVVLKVLIVVMQLGTPKPQGTAGFWSLQKQW